MATDDYRNYTDKPYFQRGMVKYTSRDYESIMEDFWEMVPKLTELWNPAPDKYKVKSFYEEDEKEVWNPEANADPGVVLGKFIASASDMLGQNLDWLANEVYAPSVSQRKNAQRIFSLIGYELGWYTAARTEVTFVNTSDSEITFDFGFNGANFCTLNAYTDISGNSRVITYNILPLTSTYGDQETRSSHKVTSGTINIFADSDEVTLQPGEMITRAAIEGELRSYSISVESVKKNNYVITIPSQHIDTTAIWIKAKTSRDTDDFLDTQWVQCSNPSEFTLPEPRFAVTYDFYSNAQIQISNYLNQLENYQNNYLTVYWFDCTGVIGCVGEDVLTNYMQAKPSTEPDEDSGVFAIHNLSNTVEWPHKNVVTGKSPETAREAYLNSRNYINTFDSLVTLPDYIRFLNREPGVDCGTVLDCQKALEINLAIYRNENLTDQQKARMYINNFDFPEGEEVVDWYKVLELERSKTRVLHVMLEGETLEDVAKKYGITVEAIIEFNNIKNAANLKHGDRVRIPGDYDYDAARVFVSNFKTYTAVCFAIYNDFNNGSLGMGKIDPVRINNRKVFYYYRPPEQFCYDIIRDYRPLQAMSVDLQFGSIRVFDWYVVGEIYLKKQVKKDVAKNIISKVKEQLALYFAPANRKIGQKPTTMEVVRVVQGADSRIDYFDAGSIANPVINWDSGADIDYFSYTSFARYRDLGTTAQNIRIAADSLIN